MFNTSVVKLIPSKQISLFCILTGVIKFPISEWYYFSPLKTVSKPFPSFCLHSNMDCWGVRQEATLISLQITDLILNWVKTQEIYNVNGRVKFKPLHVYSALNQILSMRSDKKCCACTWFALWHNNGSNDKHFHISFRFFLVEALLSLSG